MHRTARTANETQNDAPRVGMILAFCGGQLENARIFTENNRPETARLCSCTDGGRNQPVIGCRHCRGEGWVR